MNETLYDLIDRTKYDIAKHDNIISKLPDATIKYSCNNGWWEPVFSSKLANKNFTNYKFIKYDHLLFVRFICELNFKYDGKSEIINITPMPQDIKLCYISGFEHGSAIIKLSTFLKRANKYGDQFVNDCRLNIVNFITSHGKCKLDPKNLDDKMKVLLVFS